MGLFKDDAEILWLKPGEYPKKYASEVKAADLIVVFTYDLDAGIEIGVKLYTEMGEGDVFVVLVPEGDRDWVFKSDVTLWRWKILLEELGRPIMYLYINWLESCDFTATVLDRELRDNVYAPVSRRGWHVQAEVCEYLRKALGIPLSRSRNLIGYIAKHNRWGLYAPVGDTGKEQGEGNGNRGEGE